MHRQEQRRTVVAVHADGRVTKTNHRTWRAARTRFEQLRDSANGQMRGDWEMWLGHGPWPTLVYITKNRARATTGDHARTAPARRRSGPCP